MSIQMISQPLDWYDLGIFKYQNLGWVKSFLRSLKFLKINDLCIVLQGHKTLLPSITLKLIVWNKNLTFSYYYFIPQIPTVYNTVLGLQNEH